MLFLKLTKNKKNIIKKMQRPKYIKNICLSKLRLLNSKEIPKINEITVISINLSEITIDKPSKYEHLKYFFKKKGTTSSPTFPMRVVFKNCLNKIGFK